MALVDADGMVYTDDQDALLGMQVILERALDGEERRVQLTYGWPDDTQGSADLTQMVAEELLVWVRERRARR